MRAGNFKRSRERLEGNARNPINCTPRVRVIRLKFCYVEHKKQKKNCKFVNQKILRKYCIAEHIFLLRTCNKDVSSTYVLNATKYIIII